MTITTDERHSIARGLAQAAADIDQRGLPYAGILRQAARTLLEIPEDPATATEVCAGCGGPIAQPATGRRRRWCRESCRSRARRR